MKIQFKIQDFQLAAVKAVVDCFQGQALKSNKFTLERSKDIIRKAKQAASGITQVSAFETDVLEDIGYRNSSLQLTEVSRTFKRFKKRMIFISLKILKGHKDGGVDITSPLIWKQVRVKRIPIFAQCMNCKRIMVGVSL